MTRTRKIFLYATAGLLCLALILYESLGTGDFKVFVEAARLLRQHQNIYNTWIFVKPGVYCLYYYSPFFALALIPFSYLPYILVKLAWLTLNVFLMYRCWQLISRYFDWKETGRKGMLVVALLTFLFTLRFIESNFGMIQMTIYLLWSSLESLDAFERRKDIAGGLILALAINIKVLPVVLLPYLLYRGKFRAVLFTVGWFVFLLFLPGLFIGFGFNEFLLSEWWKIINPLSPEQMVESGLGVHSLTALIPSLLQPTTGELDIRRNLLTLDPATVRFILNLSRVLLVLFTLFFLRTLPFKPARTRLQQAWEISYILLIVPLIFPHQQKYAFLFMFPACAYLFYFLQQLYRTHPNAFREPKWLILLGLLILVFVLTTGTTDGLIGKKLSLLTQHYKTVTYGALLLVVALAMCSPRNFRNVDVEPSYVAP